MAKTLNDKYELLKKPEFSILNANLIATNDEYYALQELEKIADAARHAIVNKSIREEQ